MVCSFSVTQFCSVSCITAQCHRPLRHSASFPTYLTTPYCISSPLLCYYFQNYPATHFSHILINGIPPWYENGAFWLIGSKGSSSGRPKWHQESIVQLIPLYKELNVNLTTRCTKFKQGAFPEFLMPHIQQRKPWTNQGFSSSWAHNRWISACHSQDINGKRSWELCSQNHSLLLSKHRSPVCLAWSLGGHRMASPGVLTATASKLSLTNTVTS